MHAFMYGLCFDFRSRSFVKTGTAVRIIVHDLRYQKLNQYIITTFIHQAEQKKNSRLASFLLNVHGRVGGFYFYFNLFF